MVKSQFPKQCNQETASSFGVTHVPMLSLEWLRCYVFGGIDLYFNCWVVGVIFFNCNTIDSQMCHQFQSATLFGLVCYLHLLVEAFHSLLRNTKTHVQGCDTGFDTLLIIAPSIHSMEVIAPACRILTDNS